MEPITARPRTDIVHSQNTVPIYFIYTIGKPLCDQPGCWRQINKALVAQLLGALEQGIVLLYQAISVTKAKQV